MKTAFTAPHLQLHNSTATEHVLYTCYYIFLLNGMLKPHLRKVNPVIYSQSSSEKKNHESTLEMYFAILGLDCVLELLNCHVLASPRSHNEFKF